MDHGSDLTEKNASISNLFSVYLFDNRTYHTFEDTIEILFYALNIAYFKPVVTVELYASVDWIYFITGI